MIDLHAHSTCSDGSLSPSELAALGKQVGLSALALTDHDTVDGIPEFLAACEREGLRGIPGVEISVQGPRGGMHMLGYFVDARSGALGAGLARIRDGRNVRNREIAQAFEALGVPISLSAVEALAGGAVVSRVHFGQAAVACGAVATVRDAFDRFLARGKPAYRDRYRPTPEQGIAMIHAAGGVAVLAHPAIREQTLSSVRTIVAMLKPLGLDGIEAHYSEHSPDATQKLIELCATFDLAVTGGSDYHGAANPRILLGRGFGNLHVPDEHVAGLEARATARRVRVAVPSRVW